MLLVGSHSYLFHGIMLIGIIALGVWAAHEAELLLGSKDPACIVIDEIAGIFVTYFAVPMAFLPLLIGFVCFRLFDVYKPFPQLERFSGGWGVMLDDLCAGVLAQICLRLLVL